MIHYDKETKEVEVEKFMGITCSICKTFYGTDNEMEIQEFHHIHFTGGYASVFGGMSEIRCDICQYCLKIMISKYVEYEVLDDED